MKFSNSIENLDSSDDPDEVEEASIEYEICEESEEDLEGSHFVLEITSKKEEVVEEPPLCGLWNLKKQVWHILVCIEFRYCNEYLNR